jgi:hypothetical protein
MARSERALVRALALAALILAGSHGSHLEAAAAPAAKDPAPETREPLSLDEVEIRGERLVPQAVYIVGGPETDAEAAASVGDYLKGLASAPDRVPLCLILVPDTAPPGAAPPE